MPHVVGDRVTVLVTPQDPIKLTVHRHAIVTAVGPDGYVVGHPPEQHRFGPFPESRLQPGWGTTR